MILTMLTMTLITTTGIAGNSEKDEVITTITHFATAADNSDVSALSEVLDENFRVVMNQLMGSDKVVVVNRETYLQMISSGKLGGDKREVKINNIDINGKNAVANVIFKGSKFTINSYLLLVKDATGKWLVVNDLPSVE